MGSSNDYVWVCDLEELLQIGTLADHQIRDDRGDPWVLRLDERQGLGNGRQGAFGRPSGWVLVPTLREAREQPQQLAALPDLSRS